MEDKSLNNHPSLPSNYVTLAQLQERWLKQKEKEKNLQEEQQQQQQNRQIPKLPQHNPREHHREHRPNSLQQTWRAISAHAAVKRPQVESRPRNSNVPESDRVVVEINESVEAKAEIGGGNDGQDGRKKQSKKKNRKKVKRKPRADTEKKQLAEDATESTMVENREVTNSDFKRINENTELNGSSKCNGLIMEVEQKLGTVSMNSENEKQNSRVKTYDSSRGSQRNNGGRNYRSGPYGRADKHIKRLAEDAAQCLMVGNKEEADSNVQLVDDKGETKVELNGSKSDNLMSEVVQRLETMNSENEKLNSRVKTYDSSHGSRRNNGGGNYSTRPYGRVDEESKKLAENAAQSTMVGNKEVANSDVQRVNDKREIEVELNGSKSDNLMSEVEQKLGAISMNSENVKQNRRVRTYDGYRGSERNNEGRNYRIGPYGGGIRAHEVQRRKVDQKIWVRKSENSYGNVDHNEITSK